MELYKSLQGYNKEIYPMHMPGHKGGRYKLIDDLYSIDVTEVPGTDHLYQAEDILKESMDRLSDFYNTKKTVYLVNGSTVGILSAINGIHMDGDEILIARNCHQSVYHALTLKSLKPHYIYPKMTQWGLVGGIDINELDKILSENTQIVSFVMTSPTYEGFISDIERIANVCHEHHVLLIVDEAHGAHLPYSEQLPKSAVQCGADIVIHSTHKTLPTITGSGLMHLNLEETLIQAILKQLQILQTSSPSYIMMAQIDACVQQLANKRQVWKKLLDDIRTVENRTRRMRKLYMVGDYRDMAEGVYAKDPLKSIILTRGSSRSGHDLSEALRKRHNIQMELDMTGHVLGIITVADSPKALKKYAAALIREDRASKKVKTSSSTYLVRKSNTCVMTPYEVARHESEWVLLDEAVDRIASSMITPYPPGIPIVVQGEVISSEVIEQIRLLLLNNVDILGLENGKVAITKDAVL